VLAYQGGICPITLEVPKNARFHTDHCHTSGKIRGLISWKANKALAAFRDDPEMMRRAADYLENPPVTQALGEDVYGIVGKISRKPANRRYGPDNTKRPQPRAHSKENSKA
jgi:hypothetical protein